jgi:hypothetical protein
MKTKLAVALTAVACGALLLAAPASAQVPDDELTKRYDIALEPLNDMGAGAGSISLTGTTATVSIEVPDGALSPATAAHAQHVHGVLGAPNSCPDPDDADTDGDGLVSTPEGAAAYGPVQLALTTDGDTTASSAFAVDRFPVTTAGGYSYERAIEVSRELADGLGNSHVVIHGIDLDASGGYDGAASPIPNVELPFEATIPTACGPIVLAGIDLPAPYAGMEDAQGSVVRLYVTLLDRVPDPDGFAYWVGLAQGGVDTKVIARAIAASAEFEARYGDVLGATTGEWVDFVYGAVLGRNPDTGGRQHWVDQIDQGNLSRIGMLVLFADSAEFRSLTGTG